MAAEAQRELISRTGDHARDMRERMNRQRGLSSTLATQLRVGHCSQQVKSTVFGHRLVVSDGRSGGQTLRAAVLLHSPASAGRPMAREASFP